MTFAGSDQARVWSRSGPIRLGPPESVRRSCECQTCYHGAAQGAFQSIYAVVLGLLRLPAEELPGARDGLRLRARDLPPARQVLESDVARLDLVWAEDGGHRDAEPVGVLELPGNPTGLGEPLPPNELRTCRVQIKAPETPGDYVLHLTLVQENVAWFDDLDPDNACAGLVQVVSAAPLDDLIAAIRDNTEVG